MTMTSFAPTSLCAIRPSGETLLLVRPGMSRVVGRGRGVLTPDICRIGVLRNKLAADASCVGDGEVPYIRGLPGAVLGAVVAGVSLAARITPLPSGWCPASAFAMALPLGGTGAGRALPAGICAILSAAFCAWSSPRTAFFSRVGERARSRSERSCSTSFSLGGEPSVLLDRRMSPLVFVLEAMAYLAKLDCWLWRRR